MRLLVIVVSAFLLTGCAIPSSIIRELAKDQASTCVYLKAVLYGTATYCRANSPNATVGVKDGNVSITHGSK